ncbi:LLM class flavin-dependent oxidoreductase [Brevibacterium sp. GP-SGM9]|uniref:LLM class flavin-dependent oxidoreductase n=1 Tax=Brevibacterium sp. GP-SGM9 TaxID=3376990 RepID=UPI0039A42101
MSFIIGTTISPDPRTGLATAKTVDGHIDFALVPDDFRGIDALEFSSWLGPLTKELGLIPEVRVTHAEPFHIATASATLDYTARTRAGLAIGISTTDAEAALFGRRAAADAVPAWTESAQVIDVVRRLWDSWDDDAIIRDQATDRYIDRDRLHTVDAQLQDSVGTDYSVLGPSITPRPPQGHPPIVVRADGDNAGAVEAADIVLVDDAGQAKSGRPPRLEDLRVRLGDEVPILARLDAPQGNTEVSGTTARALELQSRGASGILFAAPAESQIEFGIRLVSEIVPALISAGLRTQTAGLGTQSAASGTDSTTDLRGRLGLPVARSLFAHA